MIPKFKKGDRVRVVTGHDYVGEEGTVFCAITKAMAIKDSLGAGWDGYYIKLDHQSHDYRPSQEDYLYWVNPEGIELIAGTKRRKRVKDVRGNWQ